jgi:ATP-binding cassette subfamily C protein
MRSTLRKYLDFIDRGARGRWVLLVFLALTVSILEAVGAVLVYLLIRMIAEPGSTVDLPVVGDVERFLPDAERSEVILIVSAFIAAFFLVRGLAYLAQTYFQQRIAYNAGVRLSSRLLGGYLRMPYSFHLRRNSAELIRNTLDSVNDIVASVFVPVVIIASETLLVLGILAVLVATAPLASLLTVLVLAPLVALLMWRLQAPLVRLGETRQAEHKNMLQSLQQSLQGIREIKLLRAAPFFKKNFEYSRAALARTFYVRATLIDVPRVVIETALIMFILAFLSITVSRNGSVTGTLALLGLFAYAVLRMLPSVNRIVANLNALRFTTRAIDDVHEDLERIEGPASEGDASATRLPFGAQIALAGVNFRYEGTDQDVLTDVNLTIGCGESFGLIGPTGGGKSTLVDLILGLLPPTTGTVMVDGRDIQTELAAWQSNLGVVPQIMFLMDDTIRRNIAFGIDDDAVDEEALAESVRLSQLREFIDRAPEGLDTVVGERGVRLSGGQRQRISIARALYRRPSVLVFDEGTSALDNETEAQVIHAVQGLKGARTIIMVAHRLTTVRQCDRVGIVRDGRLVDVGPFDDLVARHAELGDMAR